MMFIPRKIVKKNRTKGVKKEFSGLVEGIQQFFSGGGSESTESVVNILYLHKPLCAA